jgi:hypothetical protein
MVKTALASTSIAIVLALAIIYWLHPLNNGAVALVVVATQGFIALPPVVYNGLRRRKK